MVLLSATKRVRASSLDGARGERASRRHISEDPGRLALIIVPHLGDLLILSEVDRGVGEGAKLVLEGHDGRNTLFFAGEGGGSRGHGLALCAAPSHFLHPFTPATTHEIGVRI